MGKRPARRDLSAHSGGTWRFIQRFETLLSLWGWVESHILALSLAFGAVVSGALTVWSVVEQLPVQMTLAIFITTTVSFASAATMIQGIRERRKAWDVAESPQRKKDRNEALLRVAQGAATLLDAGNAVRDLRSDRRKELTAWLKRRDDFRVSMEEELREHLSTSHWASLTLHEHSPALGHGQVTEEHGRAISEVKFWRDYAKLLITR